MPAATLAKTLHQARLAQAVTVAWMVVEGLIAIAAGIAARSVALTAFGVDSGIELFSSAVVLHRLLERSANEERGSLFGFNPSLVGALTVGWPRDPHQGRLPRVLMARNTLVG